MTKTKSTLLSSEQTKAMIIGLFPVDQIQIEEIKIGVLEESIYIDGGDEKKFDPKTIEKEINQLKSKYHITNISFPYNYGNKFEVRYKRYSGSIRFKRIQQDEGSLEMTIKADDKMLNSIIALCFDNSISVCENQIGNFQKLYLDKCSTSISDLKGIAEAMEGKITERNGVLGALRKVIGA